VDARSVLWSVQRLVAPPKPFDQAKSACMFRVSLPAITVLIPEFFCDAQICNVETGHSNRPSLRPADGIHLCLDWAKVQMPPIGWMCSVIRKPAGKQPDLRILASNQFCNEYPPVAV